jgi:hypothetical protein
MLIFGAVRAGSLGYMARLLAEYVTYMYLRTNQPRNINRTYTHVHAKQIHVFEYVFDSLVPASVLSPSPR